ncbi:MAG: hypothetical protein ABIJ09_19220 [Pseudomonadota bacterium]
MLLLPLLVGSCDEPLSVNRAPVAFAGYDRDAVLGQPIILDGSLSSDPEGNGLSFLWTLQSPDGLRSDLGNERVARYTPTVEGVFVFFLQVDDGALRSAPDLVTVHVRSLAPQAELHARAGTSNAIPAGGSITFDGSGSSGPPGIALRYIWDVVDWPDGSLRDRDFALVTPEEQPQLAIFTHLTTARTGAFVISLRVQAGAGESDPDFVTVGVGHWSQAVRAEAQPATRVSMGSGGSASINVEARLYASSTSTSTVEWWVLAAPAGEDCPAPGDRIVTGTSIEQVPPLTIAHLRSETHCVGTWQLLICPEGAAPVCPASLCCDRHAGRVALTASCCLGLADRLQILVEGYAP